MRTIIAILAASSALAAGTVLAQSGAEVLKAKGCMNCHEADKKKVGPSFKAIAAGKKDKAKMVTALKEGKGHPKVAASDAELNAAVDHILAMK
jgi:cytochrome c